MAISIASGNGPATVWPAREPLIIAFNRADGTFTSLTNDGGDFLLNGVLPTDLANAPGWVGATGDRIWLSTLRQDVIAETGGSSGTIKTNSAYYSTAGVGGGALIVRKFVGNGVEVAITYVDFRGAKTVETFTAYANEAGQILIDVTNGVLQYLNDPLADETLAQNTLAGGVWANVAYIESVTYQEVLDDAAPYAPNPNTPTAVATIANCLLINAVRKPFVANRVALNNYGLLPYTYGVGTDPHLTLPPGRPLWWQGSINGVVLGPEFAQLHSVASLAMTITVTESLESGTTNTLTGSYTSALGVYSYKFVPTAALARASFQLTSTGITGRVLTGRVRTVCGNIGERIYIRWGNSVGTQSYWVFDSGFEKNNETDGDGYTAYNWNRGTNSRRAMYPREHKRANVQTMWTMRATCFAIEKEEAEYLADLNNAEYVKVWDEFAREFYSPQFKLEFSQPYGPDRQYIDATLTIIYDQTRNR